MKIAVPVDEAADMIGCSPSMLWKLLAQGDITRSKIGRRTVIRVSELERFIVEREEAPASATGTSPVSVIAAKEIVSAHD